MKSRQNPVSHQIVVGFVVAVTVSIASFPLIGADGKKGSEKAASLVYSPMTPVRLQSVLTEWVAQHSAISDETRESLNLVWQTITPETAPHDLLERTLDSFRLLDQAAVDSLNIASVATVIDTNELFATAISPGAGDPFYQANLRAAVAERLAQRRLFEEALEIIAPVDTAQLVDPAAFLFYKAVCEHALLLQEPGLKTLDLLINHTEGLPVRFEVLAKLMQDDLKQIKPKTLGEVARQMDDVERRLEFGRSGKKVQKVEDDIIATLDEIIKKMEEQQQQQSGGGGSGQGNGQNQSSNPAQDSMIKGSTAPGEIDKKNVKKSGSWGELPPKQETEAKNLINRNFPANYRQAIEEYFKKLAGRKAPSNR
ncbi:MAG: hypothetical protein O2955_15910 [Planctomycetota bacterium]|nr:hypothetical protein [Planctomycetota bacterium]MDA1214001.1 hypothetical protein [Planctomycetota bacterium]